MAQDDWRVQVELDEEQVWMLLDRLGLDLGSDAHELAKELEEHRLPVTHDADTVFVYAPTRQQAEQARKIVESELAELDLTPRSITVEQWLADEDRWSDEPPGPDVEEEVLARGYAPWEVRVEARSHGEAERLADELEGEGYSLVRRWRYVLEGEGYSLVRRWRYVLVGAGSREEAEELARRLHGRAEPSGEMVWEVAPQNPFAVFGGLGGTGTPF